MLRFHALTTHHATMTKGSFYHDEENEFEIKFILVPLLISILVLLKVYPLHLLDTHLVLKSLFLVLT